MSNQWVGRSVKWLIAIVAMGGCGWVWSQQGDAIRRRISVWVAPNSAESAADPHAGHDHEGHDHGAETNADTLEISDTGLKNIDFRPIKVALSTFDKSLTLPAIVVERPGHSQIQIPAPLTGVVTKIFVVEGAAIEPGSPLFELRLTHEELVTAQRDFLQSAENIDVINREIKRLETVGEGVLAGKRVLEQQYDKQKLEAAFRAQRQALILHGLSEEQIEEILKTRKLLNQLTVYAPDHRHADDGCTETHLFHIQSLSVKQGQQVEAGDPMCMLADHCLLYLEGRAFENDVRSLRKSLAQNWKLSAKPVDGGESDIDLRNLELLYLADHIDPETRAFRFYVKLPNHVEFQKKSLGETQFIQWKYRPGQRMELTIPVERLENKIVLPAEAVVEDGAENYVFQQNGKRFVRRPVHVEYRDRTQVVVENDGAIFPGDVLAARGAYQMQIDLKNKAGGAIDPHAGHNH